MIGADPNEVYFTASGSESDHWAIWGARTGKRSSAGQHMTPHVVTTAIEHPAVLQYLRSLAEEVGNAAHCKDTFANLPFHSVADTACAPLYAPLHR